MKEATVKMEPGWLAQLAVEFQQSYTAQLRGFLATQYEQGKIIYPPTRQYFAAFELTPFDKVKVVILGQDPYHGPGQAHGLCFSVPYGQALPPSLVNIYKELRSDLQLVPPSHGNLEAWAKQGVLLLNSVLTVENGKAASHQGQGWEEFTDKVIQRLNEGREHLVFILWGSYAQKKAFFVDRQRHLVIESPHPSPLSASRGFFGSKPFSRTNEYLKKWRISPIDWELTNNPKGH